MWTDYYSVSSVEDAIKILGNEDAQARIIAGGTDLMLEMERGIRKGIKTLIDVTRIGGLNQIKLDEDDIIHLGPLVTHSDCIASKIIVEKAFPLARACLEVGAPQIRNRGTIVGNLITASPANDTIPPLIALNAILVLHSIRGLREVPLASFYTGVRLTLMEPDEMVVDIKFPALCSNQRGTFYKLGLRRAQAISIVDCAVIIGIEEGVIRDAIITIGSVAPTIIHAVDAENFLIGKQLNETVIEQAAALSKSATHPIDDIRSSREYRLDMVRVCVQRCLQKISRGEERLGYPNRPVLLRSNSAYKVGRLNGGGLRQTTHHHMTTAEPTIKTRINGKEYIFSSGFHKSLLRLIREDAGLIGTKEGCAEGECGACTVFLDGMAVMSCLVPAIRAHGAEIVTIEGIAQDGELHPVQKAFVEKGAVQCGYCTPGFIMSSVMLLDELNSPSKEEISESISGNLCRCTGYYSILAAVEQAATQML